MPGDEFPPKGVDPGKTGVARLYDALPGGEHQLLRRPEAVAAFTAIDPRVRTPARANRAVLLRAVQHLIDEGARRFIDLG
ncbi:SAM-dependent methyltransferase [Streptomyces sp. NPDC003710]